MLNDRLELFSLADWLSPKKVKGEPIKLTMTLTIEASTRINSLRHWWSSLPQSNGLNANGNLNMQKFCELQFEQMSQQIPFCLGRFVYYDSMLEANQTLITENLHYAHLSRELRNNLLDMRIDRSSYYHEPTVVQIDLNDHNSSNLKSYFYSLNCNSQRFEYIQIFSYEELDSITQDTFSKYINLFKYHLDLYHKYSDKQLQIRWLEHVIHRISHQLQNRLACMKLYAENLCRVLPQGRLEEQAKVIKTKTHQLSDYLADMVYCGYSSQLKLSLQDLRLLIIESIEVLDPALQAKNLHVIYPEESFLILVDRLQIRQVFDNLLTNAIHFSPYQGSIRVNWQLFQQEVLIQLQDQGRGFPSEDNQRIFDEFYSQRSGGTGLGLAIAKKIVLDHQGIIWAVNLPQGGAQFSITLPYRRS